MNQEPKPLYQTTVTLSVEKKINILAILTLTNFVFTQKG